MTSRTPGTTAARRALALGVCLAAAGALGAETGANGFKVGEGRLHPYLDTELRMDSAAYTPGTTLNLSPEAIAHIRPGLRLELDSEAVNFGLNGNVDYVWYTGMLTRGSQGASRLEADVGLSAAFNRTGAVEVDISDRLRRSDRSTSTAVGVGSLSLFNEAKLAVPIHPGGGALEVTPAASWTMENFESAATAGLSYNNFRFELDGRWRFLPKTAFVLDTRLDTRSYTGGTNPRPMLLNAQLGLAGLLSAKIAVVAKVGWTYDFRIDPTAPVVSTIVAHAEVAYLMSETGTIKAGYLRTVEPVPAYGFHGDDRGYVDAKFSFGGRLNLHASGAVDLITFYGASRSDLAFSVDAGPEYQFRPWLIGALGYVLSVRPLLVGTTMQTYARHEGYARVTLTY